MSVSDSSSDDGAVGEELGASPILVLLAVLFVAVAWWIEPVRYHMVRASSAALPVVAEHAIADSSPRIVMLGCDRVTQTRKEQLAQKWLRTRPALHRACISDVYGSPPAPSP